MINTVKLLKVLKEILKTKNYKLFIEAFSFEERLYLIKNFYILENALERLNYDNIDKEFFRFFPMNYYTEEECNHILKSQIDLTEIELYVVHMSTTSIEYKKKYIQEHLETNISDLYNLYLSISDEKQRQEILIDNFEKYKKFTKDNLISLLSDEFKEDYLNKLPTIEEKIKIIIKFDDDNLKEKYLYNPEYSEYYQRIISSINSDELKQKLIAEKVIILTSSNYINVPEGKIGIHDYDFDSIVSSFKSDEIKIDYIKNNKISDFYLYIIASGLENEELKYSVIDMIKDMTHKNTAIASIKDPQKQLNLYIKYGMFNEIESLINESNQELKIPDAGLEHLASINGYSFSDVKKTYETYGSGIIRILGNINFKKLIELSDEEYKKLEQMLMTQENLVFDQTKINEIYEALIQRQFRFEKNDVVEIFPRIIQSANNKDTNSVVSDIYEVVNYLGEDGKEILKEKGYDLNSFIKQIMTSPNNEIISILHNLTTMYIDKNRTDFLLQRRQEMDKELNVPKVYENKYLINALVAKYTSEQIMDFIKQIDVNNLDQDLKELINNLEAVEKCIEFKRNPRNFDVKNEPLINNNLKRLNDLIICIFNNGIIEPEMLLINDPNAKYVLESQIFSKFHLVSIIEELDFNLLKEKLFNNDQIFNELMRILTKHKFIGWQDTFDSLLQKADVYFDETVIADLIGYFYYYYPELNKELQESNKEIPLITFLDTAEFYGSMASKYNYLLDKENYLLYRKNQGPNAASVKKIERLEALPNFIKKLYEREHITVPPIDEKVTINDKELIISIGDVRNPANITLGEQTGSCARMYGAGRTLFEHCSLDKNGFNIRYTDPKTGKIISKLCGFRRGNTVFLNELRETKDSKVASNADLRKTTEQIAKMFVEKTKDDEYPIKHVLIAKAEIMQNINDNVINLEPEQKTALGVYNDYSHGAVLLSDPNEKEPMDFSLGFCADKVTKYNILKTRPKQINGQREIYNEVSRIRMINELLNDVSFYDIKLPNTEDYQNVQMAIVDDDSYKLYDKDGNLIEEFYMSRSKEKGEISL